MSDILFDLDDGDAVVLFFLDLSSSAFDTIHHHIPFHRLQSLCGISGTARSWCESYLIGRTQTVTVNGQSSRPADVCVCKCVSVCVCVCVCVCESASVRA